MNLDELFNKQFNCSCRRQALQKRAIQGYPLWTYISMRCTFGLRKLHHQFDRRFSRNSVINPNAGGTWNISVANIYFGALHLRVLGFTCSNKYFGAPHLLSFNAFTYTHVVWCSMNFGQTSLQQSCKTCLPAFRFVLAY